MSGGEDLLHEAQAWSSVSRIVKLGLEPDRLGVAAQDARGQRVERAESHTPSATWPIIARKRSAHLAAPPGW